MDLSKYMDKAVRVKFSGGREGIILSHYYYTGGTVDGRCSKI